MPDVCCTRVASSPPRIGEHRVPDRRQHVRQVRPVRAGHGHRGLQRRAPLGQVAAVDREAAQQLGDGLLRRCPRAVVRRGHRHQGRDPAHLRRQDRVGHLPAGRVLDRVRVLPAPEVFGGELGEQPRAVRVDEHPADLAQRLVPGRAVDRPRHGQLLADAEDLLHQQPAVGPDRRAQPARVAAGVGQAVRVVHPQPVDLARLHPAQHLGVRGREHLRVLDADGRECRDVEEPPVGQLRCAALPRRQPVVLALVHLLDADSPSSAGARCDREGVLVVAQLGAVVGERDSSDEHLLLVRRVRLGAEDRQQDRARRPSRCRSTTRTASPGRGRGRPTTTGSPVAIVHADVVRHDVEQEPHAALARRRDEGAPPLVAAARAAGPGGVDDVVAVVAALTGCEQGRGVHRADPERVEVGHELRALLQRRRGGELDAVGRGRDHRTPSRRLGGDPDVVSSCAVTPSCSPSAAGRRPSGPAPGASPRPRRAAGRPPPHRARWTA